MGHYADKFAGKMNEGEQKFFLNTGDAKNFARKLHLDYLAKVKCSFCYKKLLPLTWNIRGTS